MLRETHDGHAVGTHEGGDMIDTSTIPAHGAPLRSLTKDRVIAAPVEGAWSDWASSEGLARWLRPADSRIDLGIGGAYEIYFSMDEPEGSRGSEGCVILSYVPDEMISFTWNAPPHLALRATNTWVAITFTPMAPDETRVRLVHTGFLAGEDWDAYLEYFDAAWDSVLDRHEAHYRAHPDGR